MHWLVLVVSGLLEAVWAQMEPTEYLVTNLQGGVVLAAVTAVVVAIGVVLFARRDLQ